MAVQLSNRRNVEKNLDGFLQKVCLPPELIYNICEKEINEDYIQHVNNLMERIRYFDNFMQENQHLGVPLAMQEVYPEL